MAYLFVEIWVWLLVAAAIGLGAGWLLWGRDLGLVRTRYRAKLHRATQNWEYVESRLTLALEELRVVRAELSATQPEASHQPASDDPPEELRAAQVHASVDDSPTPDPITTSAVR